MTFIKFNTKRAVLQKYIAPLCFLSAENSSITYLAEGNFASSTKISKAVSNFYIKYIEFGKFSISSQFV